MVHLTSLPGQGLGFTPLKATMKSWAYAGLVLRALQNVGSAGLVVSPGLHGSEDFPHSSGMPTLISAFQVWL